MRLYHPTNDDSNCKDYMRVRTTRKNSNLNFCAKTLFSAAADLCANNACDQYCDDTPSTEFIRAKTKQYAEEHSMVVTLM